MLAILILFFSLPSLVLSGGNQIRDFARLNLPPGAQAPYSIAFSLVFREFFTGISDGRIVRFDPKTNTFQDYAITTPNRSKAVCDGTNNPALGRTCGRPLALDFYIKTKEIYVTDLFYGLLKVGPNGGLATQIATGADGMLFGLPTGVVVDQLTGQVYFTDITVPRPLLTRTIEEILASLPPPSRGRVVRYDPDTNQFTVLLRDLQGPTSVALSADRTYLLISEYLSNTMRRLYIRGPKAPLSEVLTVLNGSPLTVQRYLSTFWVAVRTIQPVGPPLPPAGPRPRPISVVPTAVELNGNGKTLRTVDLSLYYPNKTVSEFAQKGSEFYVGSTDTPFVGRLKLF